MDNYNISGIFFSKKKGEKPKKNILNLKMKPRIGAFFEKKKKLKSSPE